MRAWRTGENAGSPDVCRRQAGEERARIRLWAKAESSRCNTGAQINTKTILGEPYHNCTLLKGIKVLNYTDNAPRPRAWEAEAALRRLTQNEA